MGILSRLARPFRKSDDVVRRGDDALDPFRVSDDAARRSGDITDLRKADNATGQTGVTNRVESDLQAGLRDVMQGSATRYGAGTGLGILGAGAAGSGAWIYTQQQKTEREQEQTARYEEFQDRVSDIEQRYQNGDISKAERDALIAEARENYLAAQNPGAVRSFSQYLSQLGPLQTLMLVALASGISYWVIAPIVRDIDFGGVIG